MYSNLYRLELDPEGKLSLGHVPFVMVYSNFDVFIQRIDRGVEMSRFEACAIVKL